MNPRPTFAELCALLAAALLAALALYTLSKTPDGPFTSYPHSGFCPDSPTPAPLSH